jgi:HSP20 family molecular chaperone IbpA
MYSLARKPLNVNRFFDSFEDFFQTNTTVKDDTYTYRCHIPENADLSAITATITDNVLEISVPLKKPESRKVEIKVI